MFDFEDFANVGRCQVRSLPCTRRNRSAVEGGVHAYFRTYGLGLAFRFAVLDRETFVRGSAVPTSTDRSSVGEVGSGICQRGSGRGHRVVSSKYRLKAG